LFDLMGRVVRSEQVSSYNGSTLTLDVASIPSGTYIVRVANNVRQEVAQVQIRN